VKPCVLSFGCASIAGRSHRFDGENGNVYKELHRRGGEGAAGVKRPPTGNGSASPPRETRQGDGKGRPRAKKKGWSKSEKWQKRRRQESSFLFKLNGEPKAEKKKTRGEANILNQRSKKPEEKLNPQGRETETGAKQGKERP